MKNIFVLIIVLSGCSIVNAPEDVKTPSCSEIYASPAQNLQYANAYDMQLYNEMKSCICLATNCDSTELSSACASDSVNQTLVNSVAKRCSELVANCLPKIEACLNGS